MIKKSIHPTAQQGFSQAASLYQQARPHYPQALVTWMQQDFCLDSDSHVVDLGSGTGKFLPYLQKLTPHISAVEPVNEMLEELKIKFPQVHTIQASSHDFPLAEHSIDAIFCAQAFHWFADTDTLKHMHHVLKPGGLLGLIWNQRDVEVPWVKALAEAIAPYEGSTPRYHSGDWKQVFDHQKLFLLRSVKVFSFVHQGTVENVVIKRLLSTSFIAMMSSEQQLSLRQCFEKIIWEHLQKSPQDEIEFPYVTYAYQFKAIRAVNAESIE